MTKHDFDSEDSTQKLGQTGWFNPKIGLGLAPLKKNLNG